MTSLYLLKDDFKSHVNGKNKTIEGDEENGNWGKIPYDIIVDEEKYPSLYEIRKNIPLSIGYDTEGEEIAVMRYRTLVKINKFVKDFINSLSYYKFCKRGWIKTVDLKIIEHYNFINYLAKSLDSLEGDFSVGNIAAISEMMEEMYNIFRIDENDSIPSIIGRIKTFLLFYEDVIEGRMGDEEYSYPYADINVFIDADIANVGTFLPLVEEWKPKRFYVGQIVIYEGNLYKLKDSKDLSEETIDIPNIGYKTLRYYDGYYVKEERKTYFDEMDENGKYKHWKKVEPEFSNEGAEHNDVVSKVIVESRLNTLKRKRKSYDDNGNVMPFIVNENNEVELPFSKEIRFEKNAIDGFIYYDGITDIQYEDNIIKFEYVINASNPELTDGIKYTESYEFENKLETYVYEGKSVGFKYPDIKWKTLIEFEGYDSSKLYAYAEIEESKKNADDFQDVPYYLNEGMIGLIDLKTDLGDYKMERGNSAAFEIHNVLGECCTMEDLEKYRNNFFNIKNDEKM